MHIGKLMRRGSTYEKYKYTKQKRVAGVYF